MTDSSDWKPNFAGVDQTPPTWAPKRPLRIALLGDFGAGALAGRLETGDTLARRKPLKVEYDTLEDAMARLKLNLTLPLGSGGAPVEVPINDLESFHPDTLYQNLEVFSALASLRKRLNTPSTYAKAAAEVQSWGGSGQRKASQVARKGRSRGGSLAAGANQNDFARLTGRAPSGVAQASTAVDSLMRSIVGPFVVPAANPNKDALVATVDAALSDAMRAVLHQADFQNVESLWRGVDFLLRRLETSHQLQVHLIDVSAEELAADLSAVDDLSETGLYKLLVEQPSQEVDGGYTYLLGLYHFEAAPPQLELLGRAMLVAAHAGAPFITAMDTDPFVDRKEPPHPIIRRTLKALRELPDASFLGLIGPSFMLRHPYGKRTDPIQSFAFEEFTREAGLSGMLWGHPALLTLCVLCVRGGQLAIDDLPFHHYVDADGDSTALPCTDRLVNVARSTLLRDFGINAVMAHKGAGVVRLAGLEAINGDGLAAPGGLGRKPASDTRFMLRSKPDDRGGSSDDKPAEAWAPGERRATAPSSPGAGVAAADAETDGEAGSPDEGTALAADGGDDLASSASADAGDAAASEASSSGDADLDALLASLGGADDAVPEAAATDSSAPTDEETDPELAALLASLG